MLNFNILCLYKVFLNRCDFLIERTHHVPPILRIPLEIRPVFQTTLKLWPHIFEISSCKWQCGGDSTWFSRTLYTHQCNMTPWEWILHPHFGPNIYIKRRLYQRKYIANCIFYTCPIPNWKPLFFCDFHLMSIFKPQTNKKKTEHRHEKYFRK